MITEKSCGAVVFTKENGQFKYVIIRSKEGFCGFPKGHMEGMENEMQTALREVAEETGLSVHIVGGFRTEDSYPFNRDGETRIKHIVYFFAEYSNQTPIVQEAELSSIDLMDFNTAISAFQFDSTKRILTEAHAFLTRLEIP